MLRFKTATAGLFFVQALRLGLHQVDHYLTSLAMQLTDNLSLRAQNWFCTSASPCSQIPDTAASKIIEQDFLGPLALPKHPRTRGNMQSEAETRKGTGAFKCSDLQAMRTAEPFSVLLPCFPASTASLAAVQAAAIQAWQDAGAGLPQAAEAARKQHSCVSAKLTQPETRHGIKPM